MEVAFALVPAQLHPNNESSISKETAHCTAGFYLIFYDIAVNILM